MSLDYTLDKYRELCENLCNSGYSILTVKKYLELKNELKLKDKHIKFVILRHDIDRKPTNALKMARIENDLRINSTYYFRTISSVFRKDIIEQINNLGHEVGYHYEVLSKAKGDYEKAIKLFEYELSEFRKIVDVETISMHGSPLSKYDNRDLWKRYDFKEFELLGEAYLSIKEFNYFSDTGRSWNWKNKMRDFMMDNSNNKITVNTTDELIKLIKSKKLDRLYILAHPERWASSRREWFLCYLKDVVFNVGKKGLTRIRELLPTAFK